MDGLGSGLMAAGLLLTLSSSAFAAGPGPGSPSDGSTAWAGFYGGISGAYDAGRTASTLNLIQGGTFDPVAPESPSTYSANRSGSLEGLQLGYAYRTGPFRFGPELDLSLGNVRSSATASGISTGPKKNPFQATENTALDRFAALRGQAGFEATDSLLFYGFGGLAVGRLKTESELDFADTTHYRGARDQTLTGWTAGTGAWLDLGGPWSMKIGYLHFDLGESSVNGYRPRVADYHTQSDFGAAGDLVQVSVDYALGDFWRAGDDDGSIESDLASALSPFTWQLGARYWYSTGTMRYRLHNPADTHLNSRLSYTGLDAQSGELFGRADHPSGAFLRFLAGAGSVGSGALADEDFPRFGRYSRTESQQRGAISYAAADLGYAVYDADGISVAPFVGFGYDHDQLNAYGCHEIEVDSGVCANVSAGVLTISEDADWNFVRLGLGGVWRSPWYGVEAALDGAWVPYGSLDGNDDHWLRLNTPAANSFAGPIVQSGRARGFQLDGTLKLPLTDAIDLGIGARSWYLYAHGAQLSTSAAGLIKPGHPITPPTIPPVIIIPVPRGTTSLQETDFSTRREGAFIQLTARF